MSAGADSLLPLGVPALDERLGGGIPPGRVYYLHGPPASCKTLLCLHAVAAGLARQEVVALVTGEPAEGVVAQGETLGYALTRALRKGQLAILEYDSHISERIPHETSYRRVLEDLERGFPAGSISRVIFDPFHPLVNLENRYRIRGAVSEVMEAILQRAGGSTVLVTGDTPVNDGERALHAELRRHAHGILRLEVERRQPGRIARRLVVEKTRWCSVPEDTIPFRVEDRRGMVTPPASTP